MQKFLGYIIAFAMSSFTFGLGIWMIRDYILKQILCTSETEAKVTGYKKEVSNDDEGTRTNYYCKYSYYINNKRYTEASNIAEASPIFETGEKVRLKYNPNDHYQHYIVGSNFSATMVIGGGLFIFLGGLFLVFTCIGFVQWITT